MVREVRVILKVERQYHAAIARTEVEDLLVPCPPLVKDSLIRMWGWYCAVEYITSPVKDFH